MIEKGNLAPDFTLLDTTKQPVSLAGLRGKNVVLAFFPAAFTGVCEKELCTFRDAMVEFNSISATVLGLCVDSPLTLKAFAEKNALNFPILSDFKRETVQAYGVVHENFAGMAGFVAAKRSVFVVNKEGAVAYTWIAENPGKEPDYAEVKAAVAALG